LEQFFIREVIKWK